MFARCRELGLHLVAHAGEEGPPAYVWSALDVLKVERIDHGVQSDQGRGADEAAGAGPHPAHRVPAVEPQALRVPRPGASTTCGALLDAGLVATVNSDDPAYFGGYMNENFLQTFAATGLTAQHAWQLAANSFEGSFVDAATKARWMDRLNESFAEFADGRSGT